jgi:hypothetical protein
MRRKVGWLVPLLVVAVLVGGFAVQGQLSGRFGLDLAARRVPTTLTGEIKLDTPSEFVMLEFALASNLILNASLGFADLSVDAVVNAAGPEHFVIRTPMDFGSLPFYELTLDRLTIVPEMWFAVPFEAITDVNGLPNSQVIPPGDILFVKARLTMTTSIAGFTVTQLAILEDVNFPNPGVSHEYLFYNPYPVQSQSFALGGLTSISWRAQAGVSIRADIGVEAQRAGSSIKGYSAVGKVVPDYFFATVSAGGIHLGDLQLYGTEFQTVQLGTSFTYSTDTDAALRTAITLSGTLMDNVRISSSVTLTPAPPGFGGVSLSINATPFRLSFALDTLELTSLSASFSSSLNLGPMVGSFGLSATGLERGLTGVSMRLSLAQGIFSAGTSLAFTSRGEEFGFASWGTTLTFRFSPAVVSVRVTFGRYGLTRASVSSGVAF